MFTLLLMLLFYVTQRPFTVLFFGVCGWGMIFSAGFMSGSSGAETIGSVWIGDMALYIIAVCLLSLYSRKLGRIKNITDLHERVIAGSTAGLWKWKDIHQDKQWWSPSYYKMLGYDNNEIQSTLENLRELIHPDDRDKPFKVLQDYIDGTADSMESEYRMRTRSGEYLWVLCHGEVQFEKGTRNVLRVVGSIVNIQHRKLHEQALAQQAALIDLSYDAIITLTPQRVVTSWNKSAEKIYGIKSDMAIGRPIDTLFITKFPYHSREEVTQQFWANGEWRGEAQQLIGHKKVYVVSSSKLIKDPTGQPVSIMLVNSEIDTLRINRELGGALKMLENSTQYIEQLAHISSHDLKSPIITLQGLMNHLNDNNGVSKGHETTFEMMRQLVDQMKSTSVSLSSVLQLRRNLSAREYTSEIISVQQVIRDVNDMHKSALNESGIELNIDVEKNLSIMMPHTFLKSIVYNLVGNSVKYRHPARTPKIKVSAQSVNEAIYLKVEDNGIGIDLPRHNNKLFSIFSRLQENHQGNGVGLHSVKMIVDFYRGEITIDSVKGEGTTVLIKLPAGQKN